MTVPPHPKIYHIVHIDRLPSIIADGFLWCDRETVRRDIAGTTIGMSTIKERRLNELTLSSHPDLYVGDCVPFFFCPRSVMLYVIYRGNHQELSYHGGQGSIIHLEADLRQSVDWANRNNHRWAFTTSNAGARYFEDYSDLAHLEKIDWNAVATAQWGGPNVAPTIKESKQSEFLLEHSFPWDLVSRIGVSSNSVRAHVASCLSEIGHRPNVQTMPGWYY